MTEKLKLWAISQDQNTGYDTFDSAVVAAKTEDEARNIFPGFPGKWGQPYSTWCESPDQVYVKYIGEATEGIEFGVIIASFNAG